MRRRNTAIALALVIAIAIALMWYSLEPPAPVVPEFEPAIPQAAVPPEPPSVAPPQEIAKPDETEIAPPPIDYTTGGTIQGSVSDALTNEPIQDFFLLLKRGQFLTVNPRKHRGYRAYHDPHGLFFLNDLPAEGLTVFVSAEGYEPDLRFLPGVRHDIAVADVDFKLNPVASLTVAVVDPIGQPVTDVDVVLAEWSHATVGGSFPEVRTDEQGLARFPRVQAGQTPITVFKGQRYEEFETIVQPGVENAKRLQFEGVDPLHGRVLYDGAALPGAELTIETDEGPLLAVSGADGRFSFPRAPNEPGPLRIQLPQHSQLEFRHWVDRRPKKDPLLIDIPLLETGISLNVDLALTANEEAYLYIDAPINDNLGLHIDQAVVTSKTAIELLPTFVGSHRIHIRIHNRTNLKDISSGQFILGEPLRPDTVLQGTLHVVRQPSGLLAISLTGDYVPL